MFVAPARARDADDDRGRGTRGAGLVSRGRVSGARLSRARGSAPGAQDRLSVVTYTPSATFVLPTVSAYAVVAGFNQKGVGAFSDPREIITTVRTPNPDPEPAPLCAPTRIPPPRNLRATVAALVATVVWDAPLGDCVIGSYRLSGGASEGASTYTVTLPASARSYSFPLASTQRIFVRVMADTSAGGSPPSNEVQVQGERIEGCVGLTTGSVANGVLSLQWAPTEHGCVVAGYQVQAGRTSGATKSLSIFRPRRAASRPAPPPRPRGYGSCA